MTCVCVSVCACATGCEREEEDISLLSARTMKTGMKMGGNDTKARHGMILWKTKSDKKRIFCLFACIFLTPPFVFFLLLFYFHFYCFRLYSSAS